MQFTDFDDFATRLENAGASTGAAEAQGMLCGMVCAMGKVECKYWTDLVLAELDPANVLVKEVLAGLQQVYANVISGMNDPTCELELLLPADDESLAECAQGLAEWCQGFLLGLANGGIKDLTRLPQDSREIIEDMVELSRLEHDEVEESPAEDEKAYVEIVEYVRMGVLLINEELNPVRVAPTTLQ